MSWDRDRSSINQSIDSTSVRNLPTTSGVPVKPLIPVNFQGDDDDERKSILDRKYRLNQYRFQLTPLILGREEFDRNDVPIQFKCTPDTLVNLCAKVVDALPLPSVYKWSIEDICRWLRSYGYPQYQVEKNE